MTALPVNRFNRTLCTALLLLATPAAAAETSYFCELNAHTRFGFVPPKILVVFQDGNSAAYVYDGYIAEYVGTPLRADLEQVGPNKFKIGWEVDGVKTENSQLKTQNVLRLDVGRMKASFIGYVGGYANTNRGSGTCERVKKK